MPNEQGLPVANVAMELGRLAARRERRYLTMPLVRELVRRQAEQAWRSEQSEYGLPGDGSAADQPNEACDRFVRSYMDAYYQAWQADPLRRRWWWFRKHHRSGP